MLPKLGRLLTSPFFQNKFVLYGSLFIVLLSILRYLANQNTNAVVLMALIGLITSYFSKNMIIVLLTAFVTVFVFEMIGAPGVTEGMDTKKDDEKVKKDATKEEDDTTKEEDEEKEDDKTSTTTTTTTSQKNKGKNANTKEGNTTLPTVKSKKEKQGMAKMSPANYNGKEDEDDDHATGNNANRIDYASTLEEAYDNIENIIGEEGVRGLTDQTKSLMNQQKQLMQNMKDMGPLLKSAEGFMEQITGNGGIGGITEMLKGFATPGGSKK